MAFVDAARGVAMAFVLLSHFSDIYFHRSRHAGLPDFIDRLCMIASPTFMIISGSLLGFLFVTQRSRRADLKTRMVDRGLLLLTVGHALILGAHLLYSGTARWVFITDAVGFSMIVGACLIDKLSARQRIAAGALMYVLSWIVMEVSAPQSLTARFIQEALVGAKDASVYEYTFPLLTWCALYLASTALGEWIGTLYRRGDMTGIVQMLMRLGLVGVGAAGVIRATFEIINRTIGFGRLTGFGEMVVDAQQKVPPGPVYLLFYGGIGLMIMSAICALESRGQAGRLLGVASRVGQSSLCVFVVQYYVYYFVLARLDLAETPFWPLYFVLSVGLIALVTVAYHRSGVTRLVTAISPHPRQHAPSPA